MKWSMLFLPFFLTSGISFSLQRRNMLLGAAASSTPLSLQQELQQEKKTPPVMNDEQVVNEFGILQESSNEIYFYAPMTQRSCFELKRLLLEVDQKIQTLKIQYHIDSLPIHLHIQSQGGSLMHTLYLIDVIQNLDSDVYTYVDGFAASAATLISVVGKKRFMSKHSLMLIHQLSGAESGKFNELQDQLNNMNVLMSMIVDIYEKNTHLNNTRLHELLQKDIWLPSDVCLKFGLVDEIL